MLYEELNKYIDESEIDDVLKKIKRQDDITDEKERYHRILNAARKRFGDGDWHFISSPGRSEIGGNHTDHQHGHVVAASLDIDNLCAVKPNGENICIFVDKKFKDCIINLDNLEPVEEEKNTSASLIRGIAARLKELGYEIGGFDAYCDSEVLIGSGISSSACYEVMLVEIFNCLFNNCSISPKDRALIAQYAENNYFGKPCGLMDQLAISVGGLVAVDFEDPNNPKIDSYDFDFSDYGYEFFLINTKGSHANLNDEYAAVTREIKEVANLMNVEVLRDKSANYFFENIKDLRERLNNDRALLRAFHYYNEDKRVIKLEGAIACKDIEKILRLIKESGRSSYMYLQNVYPASMPDKQPCAIGLALSDYILNDLGAYRIHGGGFAGTIQAFVPKNLTEGYKAALSLMFGDDAILEVKIRPFGTKTII